MWAMSNRNGPVLKLFLYYLIASFFVDVFFLLFALMMYCVWIVWSFCKELTDGGSAYAIARLMTWEEQEDREWTKFNEGMKIKHGSNVPPGAFDKVPYASL